MVKPGRIHRYLSENGAYLSILRAAMRPLAWVRNRALAAKLGVRRLNIGPGAVLGGLSSMRMGENFVAGPGLWMEAITEYNGESFEPQLIIGNNVSLSGWCHIAVTHYVEIGDGVLIGSKVLITDHNHGQYSGQCATPLVPPALRPLDRNRKVIVGRNCWLGDGVVVTPDSEIGEGAVIGANSVVIGRIPPFCIAAGTPARPIRRYDFTKEEWLKLT
jgi:acetyltransferase-like isoleucine patch superfamily enzyme